MAATIRISDMDRATAPYDGATLLEASVPASGGGYTSYSISLDEITSGSSGSSGGSRVSVSDSPPASPTAGDMWFDSTTATMTYVFYDGFWVPLVNQPGPPGPQGEPGADGTGVFLPLSGGTVSGSLAVAGAFSVTGGNYIFLNGVAFGFNDAVNAGYNKVFDNTGGASLYLGGSAGFPNNLYVQDGHIFQDRGSTQILAMQSGISTFTGDVKISGKVVVGPGSTPTLEEDATYLNIYAPGSSGGLGGLMLGDATTASGLTYYRNTTHAFQARDASASFALIDTNGIQALKSIFIDDPRSVAANNGGSLQLRAYDAGGPATMSGIAVVRGSITNGAPGSVSGFCIIDIARAGTLVEAVRFLDVGNMAITGDTAVKIGGGSWTAPSDGRMKRDVVEYNRGLEQVLALQPIVFSYNGKGGVRDTGSRYVGLDAGETEKVMPELVGTIMVDLDPKRDDELEPAPEATDGTVSGPRAEIKTIDSGPLVYALLNSVKELNERIAKLEALVEGGGK